MLSFVFELAEFLDALAPQGGALLAKIGRETREVVGQMLQCRGRALISLPVLGQGGQELALLAHVAQLFVYAVEIVKFRHGLAGVIAHAAGFQHEFANQLGQVVDFLQKRRATSHASVLVNWSSSSRSQPAWIHWRR